MMIRKSISVVASIVAFVGLAGVAYAANGPVGVTALPVGAINVVPGAAAIVAGQTLVATTGI